MTDLAERVMWRFSPQTLLVAAQLCMASLMVFGREALVTIPPDTIAFTRLAGGCALFLLLVRGSPAAGLRRTDIGRVVLCGVLSATNQFFFLHGLAKSTAVDASVLSTTIPVLTVVAAWVLRIERLGTRKLAGMGLALSGALVLLHVRNLSLGRDRLEGDLLILVNCVSWALFLTLVKPLTSRCPPMVLAAYFFGIGALIVAPVGVPSLVEFTARATRVDVLYLTFIVLVPTVGAYGLNQMAIQRAEASLVAVYWYLLPVFGTAGAIIRLGERPTLRTAAASTLIGAGIMLSSGVARASAARVRTLRTKPSR